KRGQSDNNKKLTGHETKYYIDEVPVKMKEYNEKVQSIITEDVFKILTNPQYFNLFLDKSKRREMIMQLVGDMSDDDITNGDSDLIDFVEKLNGRDVEEHLKIVNEKKKKVNKELESIPTRIDEIELAMPELEGSKEEIIKGIEKCNQEIEGLNEKIIEIKNGQGVSEKRKQLSELELKRSEIENEHKKNELNDLHKIKASIQEKKSNIALLMNDLNYKRKDNEALEGQIERENKELEDMRKAWYDVDSEQFEHENECVCPTCEQELPEEQIQKAKDNFNQNKSKRLEVMVKQGKDKANAIEELKERKEKNANKIIEFEHEINKEKSNVDKLEEKQKVMESEAIELVDNEEFKKNSIDIEEVEREILELIENNNEAVMKERMKISEIEQEKNDLQNKKNNFDIAERSEDRLKELEQQELELNETFEQLSKDEFMAEKY